MDRHERRDLDGVIDDVARAMTGTAMARDLRPAVAGRIASGPPWTLGWRVGLAAAGVAAVVLVAVVMRPTPEPRRPQPAAGVDAVRAAVTAAPSGGDQRAPLADEGQAEATRRTGRAVTRQTVDDTVVIAETVDISPVAIIPLEEFEEDAAVASPQLVEIAPIDVELVSIGELELVE